MNVRYRVELSQADPTRLISEIAAWEQQRNAAGARIKWMFTTEKARANAAPSAAAPATETHSRQSRGAIPLAWLAYP